MRDGVLQQCDTPQTLFHNPANLFVAAFMGSPSMNLVDATVRGGRVSFAGFSVPLGSGSPLAGDERRVVLGIRPTDFKHGDEAPAALPRITVRIRVGAGLSGRRRSEADEALHAVHALFWELAESGGERGFVEQWR